ncbi:MAG: PA14 domain-containing protein, partial [Planctomycetota bacterium]
MNQGMALMMTLFVVCFPAFAGAEAGNYRQGLAGTFFKGDDFTRPEDETHFLRSVDNNWGNSEGNDWSARWGGLIEGPYTGEVTFSAKATDGLRLIVDGKVVIDGLENKDARSGKAILEKGKKTPILLEFICLDGKAQLRLFWQWQGQTKTIVPATALSYDPAKLPEASKEGLPGDDAGFPEIEVPPAGPEHECVIKHVMVYDEPGRYAGWPANGGFWMWGNEMAVAFECGWFEDRPDWQDGHARDGSRGNEDIVARSSDGGLTWTHKKYDIMSSDDGIRDIPEGMDFGNPDFGFKCQGERFYYTYDRGKNWFGPYRLKITGLSGADENIESHTCYIINGKKDGYFFFGVEPDDAEDRFYCTRTADGGKTFDFLGWISPPPDEAAKYERWAVYSAVKVSENHLIAALRRKINKKRGRIKRLNWIDVYESKDKGKIWSFLSKVADTDVVNSDFNGNPPSIIKLRDGRLCVTYGFRAKPCVMCAKFSSDNGRTWSKPIILRTGARNWDFGYSRSL